MNESEIQYMKNNYNEKRKWCLAYVKDNFTCGIFTTQRAESIHNMMKCVLNKKSPITEVIDFVNQREFEIHPKTIEESETILSKTESKLFNKVNLITYLNKKVSLYILEKLKYNLKKSLNYKVDKTENENIW